jgi:hypothetical protein
MARGDAVREDQQHADDQVLDNHRVVRDGSFWLCPRCTQTWPYPSLIPADAGPCTPRRWGDQ